MNVLITAGPTREYIDDVRFLTNGSSGRMGYALAQAAQQRGWNVTLVSGPVAIEPPAGITVRSVTSAMEMRDACLELWPQMDGVIAVAAVADYRPYQRHSGKLLRASDNIQLTLVPNPDILAELCQRKDQRWAVGFALESDEGIRRAHAKLMAKQCDAIVLNRSSAMESVDTRIQIIDRSGQVVLDFCGSKSEAARRIIDWIARQFIPVSSP
jgi:phosphopantothenoylcysteine decarboxylase/phosphopantothenate--cysteine ligase